MLPQYNLTRDEKFIFLLALFVVATVFLLVWFVVGSEKYYWGSNDFLEYDLLAKNLIQGNGFSIREAPPYLPTALRLPGYPLFLAFSKLIVGNNSLAMIIQMLVFATSALFTFRIAKILFDSKKIAIGAALLMIFEIGNIYDSLTFMSDGISAGLALISVFYLYNFIKDQRIRDFLIGLVLISAASFIRPNNLLIVLLYGIVLLWLFFWRRAIQFKAISIYAFIFLLLVIVPFGGWAWRNYKVFGVFDLVTAPYVTEFFNVAPFVKAIAEKKPKQKATEELYEELFTDLGLRSSTKTEIQNVFYTKKLHVIPLIEDFTYGPVVKSRAKEIFKKYPETYRRVLLISSFEFFTRAKWADPLQQYGLVKPSNIKSASLKEILASGNFRSLRSAFYERFTCGRDCIINFGLTGLGRLFWSIISIGAAIGFAFYLKNIKDSDLSFFALLILGVILYISMTNIYFQGPAFWPRYRMPIAPYLFMFALFGFWNLKNTLTSKNYK